MKEINVEEKIVYKLFIDFPVKFFIRKLSRYTSKAAVCAEMITKTLETTSKTLFWEN